MVLGDICVFGDSIGKGVVLHPITRRYELFKMNIEKLLGRNMVNIKNYSMFGCTAPKVLAKVKRHASELTSYNSVFLEVGGNDCDFAWGEIAANPEMDHSPNTPLEEFTSSYRQIIEEIRDSGGKPVVLTLPPLEPNRFLNWVSRGINKDNILSWLGDVDMIYRWQEMYNIEVMLLATKMDVPIIDIRSAFLKHNRYWNLICSDGIHPNSDGYDLIYKTIGEQYQNTISV